jgi:hypothetical protein
MKTYILKPTMTFKTLNTPSGEDKPNKGASQALVAAIPPAPPTPQSKPAVLPQRQPLPTPVLYPDKHSLKLGLDV